uniref:Uncharacterized protein n=1 Tax=Oryza meridionalis TaxID=40149 RepID=A0A0E0CJ84_9ORYZ
MDAGEDTQPSSEPAVVKAFIAVLDISTPTSSTPQLHAIDELKDLLSFQARTKLSKGRSKNKNTNG